MGYFQIPVSWYRDKTMLKLIDKNPASIGVYVMMISWCSDNRSYGDIPYVDFRYVLGGENEELQALIDVGLITKTEKKSSKPSCLPHQKLQTFRPSIKRADQQEVT